MKNLRILIITDDEKSSPVAAKMVAENISALKLSANFYYAKSFDEVLNNRDKFIVAGNYDLVCLFADILSIKIYDVIDDILYRHESSSFSLLSASNHSIEAIKKPDEMQLAFLLNEKGNAGENVKEELKKAFVMIESYKVDPPKIINSVCIFSHVYTYSKSDAFAISCCKSITRILDKQRIKYSVTDPGMYKQVEIPGAHIWIYVAGEDFENVKNLARQSNLEFWKSWTQNMAIQEALPSYLK